jgi:hypothetical protein
MLRRGRSATQIEVFGRRAGVAGRWRLAGALGALAVASCSMTSVGVILFRDVGMGETSVVLRADTDVRFWADFDGLYEPSYFAQYDGINKNHCRMRCRARVPTSAPTLVRATLKTCCLMRNAVVYSANLSIQQ